MKRERTQSDIIEIERKEKVEREKREKEGREFIRERNEKKRREEQRILEEKLRIQNEGGGETRNPPPPPPRKKTMPEPEPVVDLLSFDDDDVTIPSYLPQTPNDVDEFYEDAYNWLVFKTLPNDIENDRSKIYRFKEQLKTFEVQNGKIILVDNNPPPWAFNRKSEQVVTYIPL